MACLAMAACGKKEAAPYKNNNTASISINNEPWQHSWTKVILGSVDSGIIHIVFGKGGDPDDMLTKGEYLIINILKGKTLGRIPMKNIDNIELEQDSLSSISFLLLPEYHNLCRSFRMYDVDSNNNWVEIIKQEDNFKKIWGKFNVTLVSDEYNCGLAYPYPDTLRIREAEFYVEL